MSSATPVRSGDSWRRFEAIYEQFEQAWANGEARIDDFIPAPNSPDRLHVLQELVRIDFEYRVEKGQSVSFEDYVLRYPELKQDSPASCSERSSQATFADHSEGNVRRSKVRDTFRLEPSGESADPNRPTRLGRYELREPLGKGGFAAVYRAWDSELHRDVAIKIPREELLHDPEIRSRVLREARSAARLRHPAIVPLHEVGQQGNQAYLVYEFINGPTMALVLRETRPAPEQAAEWIATLAEALNYAHQCGIVHRDVKPANVMMRAGIEPVLTDFGLALHSEAGSTITQHGDILGTPAYMSPEQASGKGHDVDGRSDVYSLGVMLYEMLTGKVPFQAAAPVILHQIIHEEPTPLRSVRANVPLDLETICLKAMAKEPSQRYETTGALAEDLRRYLSHQPIRARRIGPIGQLARWCRRRPALAGTLAAAAVTILTIGVLSYWRVVEERDRFRNERDKAQANLYRALVSDTESQLIARDTGWWWKAIDNIREASRLEIAGKDVQQLRALAIEAMGTKYYALREQAIWSAHEGPVTAIALSPDELMLASVGRDNLVRVWSYPQGKLLQTFSGHKEPVTAVAFHPRLPILATTSKDGTLCFWDLRRLNAEGAQSPLRQCQLDDEPLAALAFSLSGEQLAAGGNSGQIWSLRCGQLEELTAASPERFAQIDQAVMCLTYARSGTVLASGDSSRMVRLWDVSSRRQMLTWSAGQTPTSLWCSSNDALLFWSEVEGFGYGFREMSTGKITAFQRVHLSSVNQLAADESRGNLYSASSDGSIILSGHTSSNARFENGIARVPGIGVNGITVTRDARTVAGAYTDGKIRVWEQYVPTERELIHTHSQSAAFVGKSRQLIDDWRIYSIPRPAAETDQTYHPVVAGLAIHPDSRRLVWSDERDGITIRPLSASGREIKVPVPDKVRALSGEPAGKLFAGALQNGVQLWEWENGKPVKFLESPSRTISGLSWSVDSRYLAGVSEQAVFLWDAGDSWKGRRILEQNGIARPMALGKDLWAIVGDGNTIEVRSLPDGKIKHVLRGHTKPVIALRFYPDGKRLVSHAFEDSVRVWDAGAGKELQVLTGAHMQPGSALAIDPKERFVVAGTVLLWGLREQRPLGAVAKATFSTCEFLPDGSGLVFLTFGGAIGHCRVADIEADLNVARGTGQAKSLAGPILFQKFDLLTPGGHSDTVWSVAASPNGFWFAGGCHDGSVHLWDARAVRKVQAFPGSTGLVWNVAFSADSKHLGAAGIEVRVWDVEQQKELWRSEESKRLIRAIAFHPTRPLVATAGDDGAVRFWDSQTGKPISVLHQFPSGVLSLAFHPSGKFLAAGCSNQKVAVWQLLDDLNAPARPTHVLSGHNSAVWAVTFHPQGRYLASGSNPGAIVLWDGSTFEKIATLRGGTGEIRSLSFSGDGELLAGGAYVDRAIVWDLPKLRHRLRDLGIDW